MILDLSHRIGPLPLGGWLVIVLGGGGLGLALRKRTAARDAAAAAAAVSTPTNPNALDSTPATSATYDYASTGPSSSSPTGVTETWNIGTLNNGTEIHGSVTNNPPPPAPVRMFPGPVQAPPPPPPAPAPPPPRPAPAPAPPPAAPPRQANPPTRTYTVRAGDTYWALAQRYYGNPLEWPRIADANGYAPTRIPIGAVLVIP